MLFVNTLLPPFQKLLRFALRLFIHERQQRFAEHLLDCVAEHLCHASIGECRVRLGVDAPNAFVRCLDDLPVLLFAFTQSPRACLYRGLQFRGAALQTVSYSPVDLAQELGRVAALFDVGERADVDGLFGGLIRAVPRVDDRGYVVGQLGQAVQQLYLVRIGQMKIHDGHVHVATPKPLDAGRRRLGDQNIESFILQQRRQGIELALVIIQNQDTRTVFHLASFRHDNVSYPPARTEWYESKRRSRLRVTRSVSEE